MILAHPGWRLVLADRETGGALYVPIVGWAIVSEGRAAEKWDPVIPVPYEDATVRALGLTGWHGYALGVLCPTDAAELGAWDEQAESRLEAVA